MMVVAVHAADTEAPLGGDIDHLQTRGADMNRRSRAALHAAAGVVALLCIVTFLTSTVWVELTGGAEEVAGVKRAIVYGLAVLIPAMALVGISSSRLAGRARAAAVAAKQRRMRLIAMNGLLVLVPAAVILDRLAAAGAFGTMFYLVQGAELIAGPTNLVLLGLNFRDGLRMSRRIGTPAGATRQPAERIARVEPIRSAHPLATDR
jgi:hypothetical protein